MASRPTRPSQWRAQLGALRLDQGAASTPEAHAEAGAIQDLSLAPLSLPVRGSVALPKWYRGPWLLGAAAMATVLLALVWPRTPEAGLRVKGWGSVQVYWERDGRTHSLGEGGPLQAGDRILAEVEPAMDGYAYWLVANAAGRLLVDAPFVEASALRLLTGRRTAFAQSLKLDAATEGETSVVLICAGDPLTAAELGAFVAGEGIPARCTSSSSKVR